MESPNKRFHSKIKFEELRCEEVLDKLEELVLLIDQNFKILWMNRSAADSAGIKAGEGIGKKCHKIFHLSDEPPPNCPCLKLKKSRKLQEGVLNFESLGCECSTIAVPVILDDHTLGSLCIIRERSKIQSLERQLRERAQLITAIAEALKDGVVITDADGRVVFWNRAAEELFGYTYGEALGKPLDELIMPQEYREAFRKGLKMFKITGKSEFWKKRIRELPALRKDGKRISIEVSYSTLRITNQWYALGIIRDITERKLMEERLRSSEQRYRYLFEESQALNVLIDLRGRIIDINKAMTKTLGYSKSELIGKRALAFVAPKDRRKAWQAFFKADRTAPAERTIEFEIIGKHGRRTLIFTRDFAKFYEDGELKGFLLTGIDITERKQIELQLRESEERFRVMAEMAAIAIFLYREKFLYVNPATEKITGYSREELYNMPVWNIVHPSQRELVKERVLKRLKGEYVTNRYEIMLLRKDGTVRWIDFTGTLTQYQGQPTCIGTALDITERKEMLEKLRESETKYRSIFLNSKDLIFIADGKGFFVEINPAGLQLLGYTFEEIRKFKVEDIIENGDRKTSYRKAMEEFGYVKDFMFRLKTKKRRSVIVLMTAVAIKDQDGKVVGYNGIIRDITERIKYQRKLEQSILKQKKLLHEIIHTMSKLVEMRDLYTSGHQRRVAKLAVEIAKEMGLPEKQIEAIHVAGLLHDIGKIVIPIEILNKTGRLTELEFQFVKTHPQVAYDLLKDIDFPWPVAKIVLQHHERLDGSGYPNGLKDDEIMLEARILAVADVVEAISSHRPYRPSLGVKAAIEEIEKNKGTKYDPKVVDACIKVLEKHQFKLPDGEVVAAQSS